MKTLLLALCLAVASALHAAPEIIRAPVVTLTDGTVLQNVRFVCISKATGSVYLVHQGGVCNLDSAEFAPADLVGVIRVDPLAPTSIALTSAPGPEAETPPLATAAYLRSPRDIEPTPGDPTYRERLTPGQAVQVRGYTRKDGTYVAPHTRSLPTRSK